MTEHPGLDLGTLLADLRRVGGQARTLAERHAASDSLMDLGDIQMLEEATKRIIVALNKTMLYGPDLPDGLIPVAPGGPPPTSLPPAVAATPGSANRKNNGGPARAPSRGRGERHRPRPHTLVGPTGAMRRVHQLIDKAAACSLPVLIQGESGTGKELVARAIFERSLRRDRRFFSENCSALSESLLESELFGHVRGAFTGADRDRKGILELADGGTLFLDEIGDMSLRMQSKLLRALQEGELRPVGGKDIVRVDVRIVSATNRSMSALIREGRFREDLFYRINVVTITLPPLRDRKADLPVLVDHFLDRIAAETGLPRKECSPGSLELMMGYDWPGNIRELENVVQRAVALGDGLRFEAEDLPDRIRHLMIPEDCTGYSPAGKSGEQLMIEKALHNFEGDKTRAARFIGWSRPKLYRRIRTYGIPIDFGRSRERER